MHFFQPTLFIRKGTDMTDFSKRSVIKLAALTAVAAAALIGCGKKEEPQGPGTGCGACQGRAAENRVRLCGPGGRRWLDLCP